MKLIQFLIQTLSGLLVLVALFGCGQTNQAVNPNNEGGSVVGILNGRPVSDSQLDTFGAILALQMDGKALCSSVHLGEGYILTAYHCMHGTSSKPQLKVFSREENTLAEVGTNYDMSVPPADSFMTIGEDEHKVPQPDLTMIVLKGAAKTAISKWRKAYLPSSSLSKGAKGAYIAGYGRDSMEKNPGVGKLNYGSANVSKVSDLFYELSWSDDSNFSAGLPGDSGGPLFKIQSGKLVVYGIASILGMNKAHTKGGNLYSRLDGDTASNWLSRLVD